MKRKALRRMLKVHKNEPLAIELNDGSIGYTEALIDCFNIRELKVSR